MSELASKQTFRARFQANVPSWLPSKRSKLASKQTYRAGCQAKVPSWLPSKRSELASKQTFQDGFQTNVLSWLPSKGSKLASKQTFRDKNFAIVASAPSLLTYQCLRIGLSLPKRSKTFENLPKNSKMFPSCSPPSPPSRPWPAILPLLLVARRMRTLRQSRGRMKMYYYMFDYA